MPGPIFELLRDGVRSGNGDSCLNFVRNDGGAAHSHTGLFERAAMLARTLGFMQMPAGTPVGLLLRSQERQVLGYLACLYAGLAPALLTPFHARLSRGVYSEALASALTGSLLELVICDQPLDIPGLPPAEESVEGLFRHRLAIPARRYEGRILQFSSGTTGLKKPVVISKEALEMQLRTYGAAIGLDANDHVVSWLPLYHDMGFVTALNLPLFFGIGATLIDTFDWLASPGIFLAETTRSQATLSWNPNFFYSFMAERASVHGLGPVDLASLRGLVNCSEPVTATSQEKFRARFADYGLRRNVFWGCYAMAETTFALTHSTEGDVGYRDNQGGPTLSVGQPLQGVTLRIVDVDGVEVPEGVAGEIVASSPFNFDGYGGDEGSANAPFATGDLGYRRGKYYFITGRKKDLVIVNGQNVYPQHVEEAVSALPEVASGRVAAFGVFDMAMQSERLVVLAETRRAQEGQATDVALAIRSTVARLFAITALEVVVVPHGTLLKSSSGKISRSRCRHWFLAQIKAEGRARLAAGPNDSAGAKAAEPS